MNRIIKNVSVLLFFSLIAGCGATGAKFTEAKSADGSSIIYIYRPGGKLAGDNPDVYVDGIEIGPLKAEGYLSHQVSPGEHLVELRPTYFWRFDTISKTLNTKSSNSYYLRLTPDVLMSGYVASHYTAKLELVDNNKARDEIKNTKLSK